jgi:hypothetical protein
VLVDGEGECASLYSIIIGKSSKDEFTRFLEKPAHRAAPDFPPLVDRIYRSLDELGLYHAQADFGAYRWFRDEGDGVSALWAPIPKADRENLSEPFPSLRLYCFREENILIAGGGGIKRTRRPDDDPLLDAPFRQIKHVRKRLAERLNDETVRIVDDGFELEGDLTFPPEIPE